ncbi:excinuclease ABC subunit UvrC [Candidatus Peregrinibacteria bacterium]|nr:MAG: excinuclease ABC subunit UvrC [Candidatus Peregrinibacteria bacterium]
MKRFIAFFSLICYSQNMIDHIKSRLTSVPDSPGIYKYLSEKGEVLYVGKAKNLKKRVTSYFQSASKHHSPRITKMIEQAVDFEWIETNSELEALILEDNLIKELQPKYNILLRDDKTYQYIKVTVQDDFPEVYSVRKIVQDGAVYFGPKTSGIDVQHLLESIRRIFKLCTVKNISLDPDGTPLEGACVAVKIGGSPAKRPCLDYHIKRCLGPCAGMIDPAHYRASVEGAIEFLKGNYQFAIEQLKQQMMQFAADKKFERAAKIRDHIGAIERSAQKQLITDTHISDRDVIGVIQDSGRNFISLFQIRSGRLIAQERFTSEGGEALDDVLEAFLRDYYAVAADIPKEIIIPIPLKDRSILEAFISNHATHKSKLVHPSIGKKDDLIVLAEKNARSFAEQSKAKWMSDQKRTDASLVQLKEVLKLVDIPKRIECYDISHLSGTETVGSMVVFKKGEPAKADYRQFRLKTTQGTIDDFKSMAEVIRRRLNYLPTPLPAGYLLRKAKKADFDFIKKVATTQPINDEALDVKQFYVIEKESRPKPGLPTIVAFCRLRNLDEKVDDISSLWVHEDHRGQKLGTHLVKKCIESSKHNRVYLDAKKFFENYYLKLGFEILRKAPDALVEKVKRAKERTHKSFDFDPKDLVYMAYQKRKKDTSFDSVPDLMVIDGGKGQLSAAFSVLSEKFPGIPMISLAKRLEEVYVPGKSHPVALPNNSDGSYLLQRIRDEAHRFAITFNKQSRDKTMTKSALDAVPGVGAKLKKTPSFAFWFGAGHSTSFAGRTYSDYGRSFGETDS